MKLCAMMAAVTGAACAFAPAYACEAVQRTRDETLQFQRRLASSADSLYLARAVPVPGRPYMSTYHRVVVIDGDTPPRQLTSWPADCGEADEGLTVVFAQRVDPRHHSWRFWRWDDWVVTAFYPSEIVDPAVIARLRRTADRLALEARR